MLYSCFNDKLRLYEVFEDGRGHPINADLPVPQLGRAINGIGTPAMFSGRRLPPDAKRIGTSWHARGLIVQCKNISVEGIGSMEAPTGWRLAFGLGLAGLVVWGGLRYARREDR